MVTGQYCWSLQPGSTLLLRLSTPSTATPARWHLFCRQTLPRAHRNPVMLAHSFRQSCHNRNNSLLDLPLQQNSTIISPLTLLVGRQEGHPIKSRVEIFWYFPYNKTLLLLHRALAAAQCIVNGPVCGCVCVCVCVCGWVCYHNNSKLHASICVCR